VESIAAARSLTAAHRKFASLVMPAHGRSMNGVASLAYVAGIHDLSLDRVKDVDRRNKPGHDGVKAADQTTPRTWAQTAIMARNKVTDASANASSATARTMVLLSFV
jgi:hypothetical protein